MDHDGIIQLPNGSVPDACVTGLVPSSPRLYSGEASIYKNSENYNMDYPNRGKCLVFNHEIYKDTELSQRLGTWSDVEHIQITFRRLGFDVNVYNDYEYSKIMRKIKTVSKEDHSQNDCIVIIALTHGFENNQIAAKDKMYSVQDLWKPFTADKCITLAEKPKLFFISACRGLNYDKGTKFHQRSIERAVTDGAPDNYIVPNEADFLIGFSTPPGYVSWRNPEYGTWYIRSLCDVLDKYAETYELLRMLTKTTQEVAKIHSATEEDAKVCCFSRSKPNYGKQVPEFHSRLLRSVYLKPKKVTNNMTNNSLPMQEVAGSSTIDYDKREADTSEVTYSSQEAISSRTTKPKCQRCHLM